MARPRAADTDLPERVYRRRGSYFFVRGGEWHNLGRNRDQAVQLARTYIVPTTSTERDLLVYLMRKVAVARGNAKGRRKIPFALTKDDVEQMLRDQHFRCAVTRTPFSLEQIGPHRDRPFAPSIDRVNNADGYSVANCRLVCVATNFAINRWGDGVLHHLAKHMNRRTLLDTSKTQLDAKR